jgi:hypothetical protein
MKPRSDAAVYRSQDKELPPGLDADWIEIDACATRFLT